MDDYIKRSICVYYNAILIMLKLAQTKARFVISLTGKYSYLCNLVLLIAFTCPELNRRFFNERMLWVLLNKMPGMSPWLKGKRIYPRHVRRQFHFCLFHCKHRKRLLRCLQIQKRTGWVLCFKYLCNFK